METTITTVETPRGRPAEMETRDGTTDLATVGATFRLWGQLHDEYGLAGTTVSGACADVGAHIGTVAVAVALDNPGATVVAVEPLPENAAMVRANAERNGVGDRVRVLEAAVGDGSARFVRYGPDVHRYIGDIRGSGEDGVEVPTVTLADILREAGGEVDLLKTDCEGGEWDLLAAPPEDLRRVARIVGEYHTFGADRLHALLDATHEVDAQDSGDGTGMFRAVRRPTVTTTVTVETA